MKIWINIYNDDDGIRQETSYSEKSAQDGALDFLRPYWKEYFPKSTMPTDWKMAQANLSDCVGFIDSVSIDAQEIDLAQLFSDTSRATLSQFGACHHDSEGNPCVWLNDYECDHSGANEGGTESPTNWTDRHSCQCDDKCPTCGRPVAPHTSTFCADVSLALVALWEALPEAGELELRKEAS